MALKYFKIPITCNTKINKSYRYKNIFQIYPILDNKLECPISFGGDYPLIIEFSLEVPDVKVYNEWDSSSKNPISTDIVEKGHGTQILHELLLLLTTFSNFHFSYPFKVERFWQINKNNNELLASTYGEVGNYNPDINLDITKFTEINVETVEKIEFKDQFFHTSPNIGAFTLPKNIDQLFDRYYELKGGAQKSYRSSMSLFSNGIELYAKNKSLSFASLISSTETLIQYDYKETKPEICKKCTQPMFKVGEKFRNFLEKHLPFNDAKKIAKDLYNIRSNILHKGQLLLWDEFELPWIKTKELEERNISFNLIQYQRICLVNWLMDIR